MKKIIVSLSVGAMLMAPVFAFADLTTNQLIQQLQAKIAALQARIAALQSGSGFHDGDRVQVHVNFLKIRGDAGVQALILGKAPRGATGIIRCDSVVPQTQCPIKRDDYTWWHIDWDSSALPSGWSAEGTSEADFLTRVVSSTITVFPQMVASEQLQKGTTTVMDLREYLPNDNDVLTWFASQNPVNPANSVRWSNNITKTSGNDIWWRWQFSAWPNQNFYDIMFWSDYDKNLHYYATKKDCDNAGENCKDVVTFASSIVFGPRYYTPGMVATGNGTTSIKRIFPDGVCTGTVAYAWEAKPYQNELDWNMRIKTRAPLVQLSNRQAITITSGPCSSFDHEEHHWFGIGSSDGIDQKTMVHSWGGSIPYANDTNHWTLTFLKTEVHK